MKTAKKRIVALLLTAVMIAALCPTVFADGETTGYRQFSSIVTMGDSNAMGYGLDGYKGDPNYLAKRDLGDTSTEYTDFSYLFGGIEGSFPQIAAKTLGVDTKNCTNMNYPALRAKDMLYFLGGNVNMNGDIFFESSYNMGRFNHAAIDSWRDQNGNTTSFVPSEKTRGQGYGIDVGDYFINKLKTGDKDQLVILYAGAADVLYAPIEQAALLLDTNDIAGSIGKIVKALWEDYTSFKTNVPALIKRVKALNPDCTIALVGTFNPFKNLSISDDVYLPIFNAMASITKKMNQSYKNWAKATDHCIYIDIANVETGTLEKEISVESLIKSLTDPAAAGFHYEDVFHATPAGYRYIARQITDQFAVDAKHPLDNIIVDMGSLDLVNSVKINGRYVEYSFDSSNQKLTIPCRWPNAKTLTLIGEKDGREVVCVYKLDWSICDGYTALQVYAANDSKIVCMAKVLHTVSYLKAALLRPSF